MQIDLRKINHETITKSESRQRYVVFMFATVVSIEHSHILYLCHTNELIDFLLFLDCKMSVILLTIDNLKKS